MKEEFLHFVWKNRLFKSTVFKTIKGEEIDIIDPGSYNRDSGPDFFNSRIKIGDTEWAGNVEIHINSSDWIKHHHNSDNAYNNVILHVVARHDREINTASGICPETVIIDWPEEVHKKYEEYLYNPGVIACSNDLDNIDKFTQKHWINSMAVQRLIGKATVIRPILSATKNNWEETLYRLFCKYYGANTNSEPFYLLACSMPLKIIRKHSDNRFQIEALLFGQAGMLMEGLFGDDVYDEYYFKLKKEYIILRKKYSLKPLDGFLWKFHRMRPANFPTLRISQLAGLLSKNESMFSFIREAKSADHLMKGLEAESSEYWKTHFTFGHSRRGNPKRTGRTQLELLIINTVIPLVFLYGQINDDQYYRDLAVDLLDSIKPENNRIIRQWKESGIIAVSAMDTQGLIHLRNSLCKNRLCLNCQIGTKLISLGKEINIETNYSLEEPV